jgi:hypothetical protein
MTVNDHSTGVWPKSATKHNQQKKIGKREPIEQFFAFRQEKGWASLVRQASQAKDKASGLSIAKTPTRGASPISFIGGFGDAYFFRMVGRSVGCSRSVVCQ